VRHEIKTKKREILNAPNSKRVAVAKAEAAEAVSQSLKATLHVPVEIAL
jgi:hypothetical protein